jgi:hypothetical protein
MLRSIGLFFVLIVIPLSAVSAGEAASVLWLGVSVEYDTDAWRVAAPSTEGAVVFTCIAPECKGGPIVYGFAEQKPKDADDEASACRMPPDGAGHNYGDLQPLDRPPAAEGAIAFSASAIWSGCRAMDNPFYEACAEHAGVTYRLANHLGHSGCNFGPGLPAARFIELLHGVKPVALAPH